MVIADDIMVIGYQEDKWDHDKAFTQLLETAKKNNIKLNFDKIQYKQKEVEFFDKTYMTQGCKPSNTKVEAITEMQKPMNLKDLQTFLGMVQYLSKFSPRFAEIAEPLRDLTNKHEPYAWGPEHNQAFETSRKKYFKHPYSDTTIQRRKQSSKLIHPSRDLELVYFRMGTLSILQVSHYKTWDTDTLP